MAHLLYLIHLASSAASAWSIGDQLRKWWKGKPKPKKKEADK